MKISQNKLRKIIQEAISNILPPYSEWRKNIEMDNMYRSQYSSKQKFIVGGNIIFDGNGHATEHLGYELLKASLEKVDFTQENKNGELYQIVEFPFNVGYSECVETRDGDNIIYTKRGNRMFPSRIVLNREPEPCNCVVIVLQKLNKMPNTKYEPWALRTAYVGDTISGFEPWDGKAGDKDIEFWKKHALISKDFDATNDIGDSQYWTKPQSNFVAESKKRKTITETKLRQIISNILLEMTVHDIYYGIGEKAKAVVDYLYNEGVVAYDDEHLSAMAKDMSLIDFKDICQTILWDYGDKLSDDEHITLSDYIKTGSNPELEDQILRGIREYEEQAHKYF